MKRAGRIARAGQKRAHRFDSVKRHCWLIFRCNSVGEKFNLTETEQRCNDLIWNRTKVRRIDRAHNCCPGIIVLATTKSINLCLSDNYYIPFTYHTKKNHHTYNISSLLYSILFHIAIVVGIFLKLNAPKQIFWFLSVVAAFVQDWSWLQNGWYRERWCTWEKSCWGWVWSHLPAKSVVSCYICYWT